MVSVRETFTADGSLVSRQYSDDGGQPISAPTAAAYAANMVTVRAALTQALVDLQAILDTADIPAGTLTTAQLSGYIRTAQTQLKQVALHLKRAIRYETGDYTGTA